MSLLQVNTIRNKNGNSAPLLDQGVSISGVSTLGTVRVSSGIITATTGIITYYGDAQYLQNVGTAITSIPTDLIVSGILTVTDLNATGNVSVANTFSTVDANISGSVNIGSSITASNFYGNAINLSGIVTSLVAGSNISLSGSSGRVTVSATIPPSGLSNIVEDTTPQLGGNLDLNSKTINGVGNINITGVATASSFVGNITGNVIGNVTGTATTASHTTITNDNSSSTNNYLTFVSASSGNRPQKVNSGGLVYVPSTNKLTTGGSVTIGGDLLSNGKLTVSGISSFANGINCIGIITATDFNSSSDLNLKKNIHQIDNPLNKITQINGVSFEWKSDERKALGVIAQEVESIFPELISSSQDGYLSLNYNGLIAVLIESVKELKQEIEELKSNK
jgi:hypothetical protein